MSNSNSNRLYIAQPPNNRLFNEQLDQKMKEARSKGALYHLTNPPDAWFCNECGVFGKGFSECWSCGSTNLEFQFVPRWGGGAQTVSSELEIIMERSNT